MMNDRDQSLKMPEPENNGFVRTLNNMGYMTSSLDPYSKAFVEFSAKAKLPVLDIGAAYGVASLEALKLGARVIANDIDQRHLDILYGQASKNNQKNIELQVGAFPSELDFKEDSLGAVLICRVLHFFDGPTIENAAHKVFKWLSRGGKVFIITETPYLKSFQSFIPVYEERKANGEPFPGFIEDVKAIAPERGKSLPPQMHLLDPDVLTRIFTKTGFQIEKCATFARTDFPQDLQLDGRESVGLVAIKGQRNL